MLFKMILREECNVGARLLGWYTSCSGKRQSRAETSAPPGRTPIKNLPQMSQMRTDLEGMASCHTHAALLGVAAVSAAPTKHSCTNINYPTEFTDFTEFSGCVYSPTDCTDVHRLGGYGIPAIPTQPLNYLPTEPYAA